MTRSMPRMMPRYASLAAFALLAATVACGSLEKLDGAIGDVPVAPGSSLKDQSSAYTSDDFGDPMKFHGITWDLETKTSPADVEAFYMQRWPQAGKMTDEEEGTVTLRNPPLPTDENTPLTESMSVTIHQIQVGGKTQYSVNEDVYTRKRP